MRPPGHPATIQRAIGFCSLDSRAYAALEDLATATHRLGVCDIDFHHWTGPEAILQDHAHAAFSSIHRHPCYPGTGTTDVGNNCFHFPVPPRLPRLEYRKVLTTALQKVRDFKPSIVGVSAG